LLSLAFGSQAATYQLRQLTPGMQAANGTPVPLGIALSAMTLPNATRGVSYAYDFSTLLSLSGTSPPAASALT